MRGDKDEVLEGFEWVVRLASLYFGLDISCIAWLIQGCGIHMVDQKY